MGSSEDLAGIRRCFEELKNHSVDPHNYKGLLFDVVFEIITADTYIAGIASRILDGEVMCPFGEPAQLRKKRARPNDLPYQSRSVVMVGRSIRHFR